MIEAHHDAPGVLDEIEAAPTPREAMEATVSRLSLRRLVELPLALGRDVVKIVMNGDAPEAVRAAAHIR